ncbi:MAG: alpha/beta fold hydrolase [Balneolaceae bacterium]|nr:alpha/beta fold hydrolase [Balneolaceae bacterium]
MLSSLLWIIGGLLAGYLLLLVILYVFQAQFIYHPTKSLPITPKSVGLKYQDVNFTAEDGTPLHGWYVPNEHARGTVLFQHGNAGNISGRLETIEILNRLGLNVLIYDYRGYGRSDGSPSEEGTYMDAMAAWNYLTEEKGVPPGKIILMGRSLGGGVTSWLANHTEPAAVILESTFTSAPDLATDLYPIFPTSRLIKYSYPNEQNIKKIKVPILIAHSPEDGLIPYKHGKKLFDIANEPKQFYQMQGDHGDGFLLSGDSYVKALGSFVDTIFTSKKVEK